MKKRDNQPIDELFARKLGNASLSPEPAGFERLQARMNQGKTEARVVFWRNPAMQRYMAVAACLVLVCLFGWLAMQSGSDGIEVEAPVALQLNQPKKPAMKSNEGAAGRSLPSAKYENKETQRDAENQLADVDKQSISSGTNTPSLMARVRSGKEVTKTAMEQPVLAQLPARENEKKSVEKTVFDETLTKPVGTEQLAENKAKPLAPTERVLTVTIEEPKSIIIARQVADKAAGKEVATVASIDEEIDKETKGSNLWQQVKRIKQGEVFARHDRPNNEDRGLLERAYSGLKQSFEKDKSEKQ